MGRGGMNVLPGGYFGTRLPGAGRSGGAYGDDNYIGAFPAGFLGGAMRAGLGDVGDDPGTGVGTGDATGPGSSSDGTPGAGDNSPGDPGTGPGPGPGPGGANPSNDTAGLTGASLTGPGPGPTGVGDAGVGPTSSVGMGASTTGTGAANGASAPGPPGVAALTGASTASPEDSTVGSNDANAAAAAGYTVTPSPYGGFTIGVNPATTAAGIDASAVGAPPSPNVISSLRSATIMDALKGALHSLPGTKNLAFGPNAVDNSRAGNLFGSAVSTLGFPIGTLAAAGVRAGVAANDAQVNAIAAMTGVPAADVATAISAASAADQGSTAAAAGSAGGPDLGAGPAGVGVGGFRPFIQSPAAPALAAPVPRSPILTEDIDSRRRSGGFSIGV